MGKRNNTNRGPLSTGQMIFPIANCPLSPSVSGAVISIISTQVVNASLSTPLCRNSPLLFSAFGQQAGTLSTHLKTRSGEKSNKCNQWNYASTQGGNLRRIRLMVLTQ